MMSEAMKQQFAMFEDVLESAIMQNVPNFGGMIIKNRMYNSYLGKVENFLAMFMDEETGEINGVKADEMLNEMMPVVATIISIPRENFYLKDFANQMAMDLIGREVI